MDFSVVDIGRRVFWFEDDKEAMKRFKTKLEFDPHLRFRIQEGHEKAPRLSITRSGQVLAYGFQPKVPQTSSSIYGQGMDSAWKVLVLCDHDNIPREFTLSQLKWTNPDEPK